MVILDREVGKIVIFDETGREVISSQELSILWLEIGKRSL